MEKLKVDDKLYFTSKQRWGRRINYRFETVVRLTKTQAVLSDGTKLINEPTTDWSADKKVCYSEYGNRYDKWYFQTEEILLEAKKEKERQSIESWFESRKFSDEEKRIVYLKFKELDILTAVAENS